jgi:hypothetical protein
MKTGKRLMSQALKVLNDFKKRTQFKSLKEFHAYLVHRGFSANYQHFAKILNGQATPTTDIIGQLNLALPDLSDELTMAHCKDLFPQKSYMFESKMPQKMNATINNVDNEPEDLRQNLKAAKVSVLNESQIATLSHAKQNYFLFLVCTMARKPILISEINELMGEKVTKAALSSLLEAGIILKTESGYQTFNTEIKFPAKSKFNESIYKILDQWDLEFTTVMNMEMLISKTLLRRISPRYLGLIQGQIQLLIETLRISDESETKYNSEVIQLSISLFQGKLPG